MPKDIPDRRPARRRMLRKLIIPCAGSHLSLMAKRMTSSWPSQKIGIEYPTRLRAVMALS